MIHVTFESYTCMYARKIFKKRVSAEILAVGVDNSHGRGSVLLQADSAEGVDV